MRHESPYAAAIISIGDELMLGQRFDTNAPRLSQRLLEVGISTIERVTLHDDHDSIAAAIARLARRVPLVLITGGLGPTDDDLTRQALATALGEPLVMDEQGLRDLEAFFRSRGRELLDRNRIQAMRPHSAALMPNPHGTAPGIVATLRTDAGQTRLFALPGPPREMEPMYEHHVLPELPRNPNVIATRILHTLGIGESDLATRLGDLMQRDRNTLVGTTASGGSVTCRVRYEGPAAGAEVKLDEAAAAIRRAVGDFIVGEGEDHVAATLLRSLGERGGRLVTAESCTGGLLGAMVTAVPGSSEVYIGGWQTYSNVMKRDVLGVPEEMLERHGAVSREVATAMALGALRHTPVGEIRGPLHALSITGIAGPGGGTEAKPVGTVFIGRAARFEGGAEAVEVRRFQFRGEREFVRDISAKMALTLLLRALRGTPDATLLWERREADGGV